MAMNREQLQLANAAHSSRHAAEEPNTTFSLPHPRWSVPPTVTANDAWHGQTQPTGAQAFSPTPPRWQRVPILYKGAIALAVVLMIAVSGLVWRNTSDGAPASQEVRRTVEASAEPVAPTPAPPEATFRFDTVKINAGGKVIGREVKQGRFFTEDLGSGTSIDMVAIPAGKFLMGTHETEQEEYTDEGPEHEVTLKRFYMSKFEVTQANWRAVAAQPRVTKRLESRAVEFQGRRPASGEYLLGRCRRVLRAPVKKIREGVPAAQRVGVGIRCTRRVRDGVRLR